MKVEDAKQKWCPMARVVPDVRDYASGNRFPGDGGSARCLRNECRCIGPECMMWVGSDEEGDCGLMYVPV